MSKLLIVGAGGHGAVVAEAASLTGQWDEIQFLDDNVSDSEVLGFAVIGNVATLFSKVSAAGQAVHVHVAIGDNAARVSLCREVLAKGLELVSIIHPTACVSPSASIAPGTAICAGVVVSARATVGEGCIVNTAATIDHDCVLGEGVHVSPGANLAGNITVGKHAWIGIGAAIREGLSIGAGAMVAAGAAVVTDVAAGTTVGGVPAKPKKAKWH